MWIVIDIEVNECQIANLGGSIGSGSVPADFGPLVLEPYANA